MKGLGQGGNCHTLLYHMTLPTAKLKNTLITVVLHYTCTPLACMPRAIASTHAIPTPETSETLGTLPKTFGDP